ncbi:hypothetical protein J3R83DRAFT_2383 [Lanmaoa asiatica]|nr:hypothetical protein J3R83DRAFT_2383 [Lanmaoa asiatica]
MPRDYCGRKLTGRHRFRDVSLTMKLMDIFESLRRRRLRRNVSRRSSLTRSRNIPPPFDDHDSSPVQLPSPNLSTSPPLHISRYRSDSISLLNVIEKDCSSGMSTSCSSLEGTTDVGWERRFSTRPVPAFPTSPSTFQLRSTSMEDYLVERLEQHLGRLSLGEGSSDQIVLPKSLSRDISMDMCVGSPNVSLQRIIDPGTSSCRVPSDRDAPKPTSSPQDQNVVPMILITSVDAKHAKPLPPSTQRSSRTPFGPSNLVNRLTNAPSVNTERKKLSEDPFTTQPHDSTYPPDYNLTFRLPSFPSAYSGPTKYAPETPTPMCCDHFGDCSGDLWEILHPPLVAGTFTLPPFKLPPLSTGLFDDVSTPLPY